MRVRSAWERVTPELYGRVYVEHTGYFDYIGRD